MRKNKESKYINKGKINDLTQDTVDAETRADFEDHFADAYDILADVNDAEKAGYSGTTRKKTVPSVSGRRKKKDMHTKRNKMLRILGTIIAVVQLIASGALLFHIIKLDILPVKHLAFLIVILIVLEVIALCSQIPVKTRGVGIAFSLLISVLWGIGCVYLVRTHTVLAEVTVAHDEENYRVDNIVVAVLADDQAQSMSDTLLYNFGILKTIDRENTDAAIAEIESSAMLDLSTTEFDDFSEMFSALTRGEIQAVIYNAAYEDTFEESVDGFTEQIRILNSHEIKTQMYLTASDLNVTQEPFTIYISGIDVYGEIETTSRSDVNILVTVNPQTKEIVMTTTPRDYYVLLPDVSGSYRDKLTHAGLYGVDCSVATLSQLYGIQIDYYVRVNFTTLKKIVDALGGVNVYSEYEFTTHYKNGGYDIQKGYNMLDGKVALAFARERYNLPGGDEQRGRNQLAMLKALLEKAMSPSILTGYLGIMDSLEGSFETNMGTNEIASLVKMQLADGAGWDIEMQNATGVTGSEACYSAGYQRLSIMYENLESITACREKILAIGGVAVEDTMGRFTSPDGSVPLTDTYGNVIGYNTPDGYISHSTDSDTMVGTSVGADDSGEFDSSLGDFADSPTILEDEALKSGFNYYKGE